MWWIFGLKIVCIVEMIMQMLDLLFSIVAKGEMHLNWFHSSYFIEPSAIYRKAFQLFLFFFSFYSQPKVRVRKIRISNHLTACSNHNERKNSKSVEFRVYYMLDSHISSIPFNFTHQTQQVCLSLSLPLLLLLCCQHCCFGSHERRMVRHKPNGGRREHSK